MPGIAHIGFDFGSSLIKVAVRLEDVGERQAGPDAAFGIVFQGDNREGPYKVFRPTQLRVTGSGDGRRIFLRDAPLQAARITGIKERLMGGYHPQGGALLDIELEGCGLTLHEAAALLLASTMDDVRVAIATYAANRQTRLPSSILVNCAVPSSDTMRAQTQDAFSETACPHRTHFQALMERVRRAVFLAKAGPIPASMTVAEARALAQRVLQTELPSDPGDWATACIPEALAAVIAAVRHPEFRRGLFFVYDIGAFTTDASLFHFHPGQDYRIMVYYGIGSSRAGIGHLGPTGDDREALAHLSDGLQDLYRSMLESMMDQYGRTFQNAFLRSEPSANTPIWRSVVLGGGATRPDVRSMVGGLGLPSKVHGAFRVRPIGRPPLVFPIQTYSHLVFIRRPTTHRTYRIADLRDGPMRARYLEALVHPSHILQLAMGLSSSVFSIPTWSASEPIARNRRPDTIPEEAWERFHPWTGL